MFGLGLPELVLIIIVVGILFFGSEKITGFARSIGRASGEFKKGKRDIEEELKRGEEDELPHGRLEDNDKGQRYTHVQREPLDLR